VKSVKVRRLVASAGLLVALAACGGAPEPMPRRVEALPAVVLAGDASALRDPAGARPRLEAALAKDPGALTALSDLALTWFADDRLESARQLLDLVVARGSPRDQQLALVNLAATYAEDGYLQAAIAHCEAARDIDPGRPEAYYALALLASGRGERERAAAVAREALRLDDGGATRASLAYLHPEARLHLEAVLAEARGEAEAASARWRELRGGRFPALAAAAERRLEAR
jgi:tetratricopeptide (TPR) repeat protein